MIGHLVALLTGDVSKLIAKAYADRNNAQTEQQRIAADVRIAELEARQANRELGGRITALVQAAWAAPFVIYTWKLVYVDKVLEAGVTDPLSPELLALQERIATLYFGGAAFIGVVKAFRR